MHIKQRETEGKEKEETVMAEQKQVHSLVSQYGVCSTENHHS